MDNKKIAARAQELEKLFWKDLSGWERICKDAIKSLRRADHYAENFDITPDYVVDILTEDRYGKYERTGVY